MVNVGKVAPFIPPMESKPSYLDNTVGDLKSDLDRLANRVAMLGEQLKPLIHPADPKPKAEQQQHAFPNAPLAKNLEELRGTIRMIYDNVDEISECLIL
jgi:hypothetical protein